MKDKHIISSKLQNLEKAMKEEWAPFQFIELQQLAPFLGSTTPPSLAECEDLNMSAYHMAYGLVEMIDFAQSGLEAESSVANPFTTKAALRAVELQLEIMRLTALTSFQSQRATDQS